MPAQLTARPSDIPLQNLYNLLEPITVPKKKARFRNWGRSFICTPSAIFEPENEFQCELVLELARREGKKLRVSAVGHSPSDLAMTNEYMLRTTKLNRVLEVRLLSVIVLDLVADGSFLVFRYSDQHGKTICCRAGRHHPQRPQRPIGKKQLGNDQSRVDIRAVFGWRCGHGDARVGNIVWRHIYECYCALVAPSRRITRNLLAQ